MNLPDDGALARMLAAHGLVSADELQLAQRQAKATGTTMARVLLNLNLVTAEALESLVRTQVSASASNAAVAANVTDVDSPGLIEQLFERAAVARATDIHFDPQEENRLRVRFRIDGQLHDVLQTPSQLTQSLISRLKLMANLDIIEKRESQDGHILRKVGPAVRNYRIATVPTTHGERLVVRIMENDNARRGMDDLGLNAAQTEILVRLLGRPYGIIVVSGPVGAGKTTTLYSCLNRLNVPSRNIMTVEDPVEFSLPGANQLQVDPRNDWTFPKALRSILRQDPDVVMVGEIRDVETAQIAVRASLTGVLVLTFMHANDAAGTIGTLFNFGVPGYLLASTLLGIVSQRLLRVLNPKTSEAYAPDERVRKLLGLAAGQMPELYLRRARGSERDFSSGFLGRCGVFEVLEIDELLRDLIVRESSKDVIREVAIKNGMLPLVNHAIAKVVQGITTVEEIFRVAVI